MCYVSQNLTQLNNSGFSQIRKISTISIIANFVFPYICIFLFTLTDVSKSAIHKVAGLTVPSHSMIFTGTIPEEWKNVHWL